MTALQAVAPAEKPDSGRIEAAAYMARSIANLAWQAQCAPDESGDTLRAIAALAINVHDSIDHYIRGLGDPGLGYQNPILAELDDALRAEKAAHQYPDAARKAAT